MTKLNTVLYSTIGISFAASLLNGCFAEDRRAATAFNPGEVRASEETGATEEQLLGGASHSLGGATFVEATEDSACDSLDCGLHATCVSEGNVAQCRCLSGYSGLDCTDINECAIGDRCGPAGHCVNYPGTYACECPVGMRATGNGCEDIDECDEERDACDDRALCTNTEGSHLCTCQPGLSGDGTFCLDEDHCANHPCGQGECENTRTGYACSCPLGTSGAQCESTCPLEAPIEFASPVLEAAVRQAAGLLPGAPLTPTSLSNQNALTVPPPDNSPETEDTVNSLAGLQCWTTLEHLDLKGHPTQDLSALAGLSKLRTLDLQCSQSADYSPLANLLNLRSLNVSRSSLCGTTQRAPVQLEFLAHLSRLEQLHANGFGYLADLSPASGLARLEVLSLRGVEVSDIEPLASLSQLHEVSLAENPLETLAPLSALKSLRSLDLASTSTHSIEALSALFDLEEVDLGNNRLTSVAALASLTALRTVYLNANQIESLRPFESHPKMLWLDASSNAIVDLSPLAENFAFSGGHLRLDDNPLDCAEVSDDLETLSSRGVSVSSPCR